MIVESLQTLLYSVPFHPSLSYALEFLKNSDHSVCFSGKKEIVKEQLYATAYQGKAAGRECARLEAHRKFIDIHYVISGFDLIGWQPLQTCTSATSEYDSQKDIIFFGDKADSYIKILPGYCAVFFPHDAHAPLAGDSDVFKIVVKILVN